MNEEIIDGNKYKLWKVDKSGNRSFSSKPIMGITFSGPANDDNNEMGEVVLYLNNKTKSCLISSQCCRILKKSNGNLISAVGAVEALYYPDYLKKYSKLNQPSLAISRSIRWQALKFSCPFGGSKWSANGR
ncbi:two-component system regulatory protein YycI [Bacillus licheniformis]|nr:two-component system regulatory protein YycI [Bacillus licheniformis]